MGRSRSAGLPQFTIFAVAALAASWTFGFGAKKKPSPSLVWYRRKGSFKAAGGAAKTVIQGALIAVTHRRVGMARHTVLISLHSAGLPKR